MTDTHLVGEWRSDSQPIHTYEVYEADHQMSMEYWGGYARQNRIHRKVLNLDNQVIKDEYVTENRAIMMYEPFLQAPSE